SAEFEGSYSPTFLRLEERLEKKGLEIPLNRSRPIAARTDAENGYLQRADNPGRVILDEKIRAAFTVREHLKDGRLTIYFTPKQEELAWGKSFKFRIELQDDAMAMPVRTEELFLRVLDPEVAPPPPPSPPRPPRPLRPPKGGVGGNKQGTGENAATHGLPR